MQKVTVSLPIFPRKQNIISVSMHEVKNTEHFNPHAGSKFKKTIPVSMYEIEHKTFQSACMK